MNKITRTVDCGGVPIGGGAPIPIQSMTNTDTEDAEATLRQIARLSAAGCDIVRCAVPTAAAAKAIREITQYSPIPVVADIHFDYRLAIAAIRAGAHKVRINPGNIGSADRVRAVADAAKDAGIPIRIGVNSGSLEADILEKYGGPTARALAESALRNIELLHRMDFFDLVVSIKSSDVVVNTKAHRLLADKTDHPLHIGITEAGIGQAAVAKSAAGIGALLALGLGDTVRVSLTGDPVSEISVARDILRAANRLPGGISLISCPTCGRCRADLEKIASEVAAKIFVIESARGKQGRALTVAVMGCAVNGPGEASHADFGVACGETNAVYFERGKKIRTIRQDEIVDVVAAALKEFEFS
jgi:(E)-4-hydroxy-3-methylbut-2-enyl-diphosphate synthase